MQVAFWPKAPKRQPALKLLHLLGTPSKSSGRIGTASKLRQLNERLQSIRYSLHHKCFMPILSLGYIPSYALGKVASRPRWPLLLGIPSISGLKFRTGYNHACSQRSFSSSFNSLQGQTEKLIFKNPTAVTWLTQTPFAIVPRDVISSLPVISPISVPETIVPILLVTPAFASWIDLTNSFLEECMNELFAFGRYKHVTKTIHSLAAVVDKLPTPRNSSTDGTKSSFASEGLSLMLVSESDVLGRVARPSQGGAIFKEPTFMFSLRPLLSSAKKDAAFMEQYEVGLRLANTIFANGKERTLQAMRWEYHSVSQKYVLGSYRDLSNCTVTSSLDFVHGCLEVPLHPVTRRRKVVSSMGNILRQISRSENDRSNEPIPASSELERELPRYVDDHNIDDPRLSVWALVQPSGSETGVSTYSLDQAVSAIQQGGRLHRVVSGGGGWGKKQGLLSLDPEISFNEMMPTEGLLSLQELMQVPDSPEFPELSRRLPLHQNFGVEEELTSLSQAAKEGDYIQFFVFSEWRYQKNEYSSTYKDSEGTVLCFGVAALSDDETWHPLPSKWPNNHLENDPDKDLVVLPNYFGALSEKGITYSQAASRIRTEGSQLECCTKLCVPGCRVEFEIA